MQQKMKVNIQKAVPLYFSYNGVYALTINLYSNKSAGMFGNVTRIM
jgi:hypothetical protein